MNMDKDTIRKIITDYIVEEFKVDREDADFAPGVNLFEYGFIDSLGAVKMMGFIEKKFETKISNKEIMMYPMNSIDEITDFVERKVL